MFSRYQVLGEETTTDTDLSEIAVEIAAANDGQSLPARVVVTASDGSHPDGAGNGVYADGRFFCRKQIYRYSATRSH